MVTSDSIYKEKYETVEVERIYTGDKSVKELLLELLQKKLEAISLRL